MACEGEKQMFLFHTHKESTRPAAKMSCDVRQDGWKKKIKFKGSASSIQILQIYPSLSFLRLSLKLLFCGNKRKLKVWIVRRLYISHCIHHSCLSQWTLRTNCNMTSSVWSSWSSLYCCPGQRTNERLRSRWDKRSRCSPQWHRSCQEREDSRFVVCPRLWWVWSCFVGILPYLFFVICVSLINRWHIKKSEYTVWPLFVIELLWVVVILDSWTWKTVDVLGSHLGGWVTGLQFRSSQFLKKKNFSFLFQGYSFLTHMYWHRIWYGVHYETRGSLPTNLWCHSLVSCLFMRIYYNDQWFRGLWLKIVWARPGLETINTNTPDIRGDRTIRCVLLNTLRGYPCHDESS
jgi:hypothetical protein